MLEQARYVCIDKQWSVTYLPERPNGFAILLLNDHEQPVEERTSIWEQHPERRMFLLSLLEKGYTVLTSNLFGRHWGNEKACRLAELLYYYLQKREILNKRVHLVAEGTGALVAFDLLKRRAEIIRSSFFINPCIYPQAYYYQEKQNKLFYKRFLKELEEAYQVKENELNSNWFDQMFAYEFRADSPPIRIMHDMHDKQFPFETHSKSFEQKYKGKAPLIQLSLYGRGKTFSTFIQPACSFFEKNEKIL
ncbi:alpha/beta hydrolase [Halalkalibacter urbisdiaboli]|uniref:alpha/beta hydrolase n=1 Tax=Halalkalibacter urbisdiaboli TaxID=1960589 RepID=UPI000B43EB77|nr:alpha/beta hydrolase [Halalkalibacter urbisdiaboli]